MLHKKEKNLIFHPLTLVEMIDTTTLTLLPSLSQNKVIRLFCPRFPFLLRLKKIYLCVTSDNNIVLQIESLNSLHKIKK